MGLFRRKKSPIDRRAALSGRPRQGKVVSVKDRPDGGAIVKVLLRTSRWMRMLPGKDVREQSYGLDPYGLELFEACDGKRSVQALVSRFAKGHKMSRAEAELSVTAFLKALLAKGMVVMEMDVPSASKRK